MKKRNFIIAIVLIASLSLLAISRYKTAKYIVVKEIQVENTILEKTVSADGRIIANSSASLSAIITGNILSVPATVGMDVKKGDVLVQLDGSVLFRNSQELKGSYDIALKDREIYIQNYATHASAIGGEKEYFLGLERQNELVNKAKAAYEESLSELSKATIKAPFEGTVIEVLAKEGETASLGKVLIDIADLNTLVFEALVDQEDVGYLSVAQKAEIVLDAFEGEKIDGKISSIEKVVNESSQNLKVNITFDNKGISNILIGMKGDVNIVVKNSQRKVKALPFDVILDDANRKFIWIDDKGKLKRKYIETGLEGNLLTEVLTNLTSLKIVTFDTKAEVKEGLRVRYE